jgi:hypothetical protein
LYRSSLLDPKELDEEDVEEEQQTLPPDPLLSLQLPVELGLVTPVPPPREEPPLL